MNGTKDMTASNKCVLNKIGTTLMMTKNMIQMFNDGQIDLKTLNHVVMAFRTMIYATKNPIARQNFDNLLDTIN